MTKIINLSLLIAITLSSTVYASSVEKGNPSIREKMNVVTQLAAEKANVVDSIKYMFQGASVTGNIRSMYSGYNNYNDTNTYATAVGGQIKYELAKYKGFNGAVNFLTSHDIDFASGNSDEEKRNNELASSKGSYTTLIEAYINYEFQGLNLRIGRQIINTPLADSDDIRMTPDTFEGYIATYKLDGFALMAGHLNQWQGYDAGLDNHWIKTGKNGTNFGGMTYSNNFVTTNLWYYNISGSNEGNNAIYIDTIGHYTFNDDLKVHAGVQYLNENEVDNSGIKAHIYGAIGGVTTHGFNFTLAYNKSLKEKNKTSFSGFGGGTLFTSMDTMILDNITTDKNAKAIVSGLSYEFNSITLSYAYGDFIGEANSAGVKAHIIAQNLGLNYSFSDDLSASTTYVIDDNKDNPTSTNLNDKNLRVFVSYNF